MKSNKHVRDIRRLLKCDYSRYRQYKRHEPSSLHDPNESMGWYAKSSGVLAVLTQRLDYLNHIWYRDSPVNPMKYYLKCVLFFLNYLKRTVFKIIIPKHVCIGPGLVLSGRGEIVAGALSIGKNCTLNHRVTIGIGGTNRDKPSIGDDVYVESDVLIFGGIRIGNNVRFKKGTVCSKNIPDNCIVEGNPARIIRQK